MTDSHVDGLPAGGVEGGRLKIPCKALNADMTMNLSRSWSLVGGMTAMLFLLTTGQSLGATDEKVSFALTTTDADGAAIAQQRFYYVYRPDGLPRTQAAPMVLVMECRGGDLPAKFFHRKADEAGFVLVSCAVEGNSTGNRG